MFLQVPLIVLFRIKVKEMIKTATASTFIAASPALVFDIFTHYETYRKLAGVKNTRLITPGQPEAANGVGAVRELDLGVAFFHEQVTGFKRPHYWDYKFIDWPLPFAHHVGGRMSFEAVTGGTRMTWQSTIEAHGVISPLLPVIAWLSSSGLKVLSIQMKRIVLKVQREGGISAAVK